MIKKILLKWIFFLYRKEYNKPLNEIEIEGLMTKLANMEDVSNLPAYLDQCANNARNQYLYSKDEILKGTILAFITLKEQILKKKHKEKKKLTDEEKNVIMKKRGY